MKRPTNGALGRHQKVGAADSTTSPESFHQLLARHERHTTWLRLVRAARDAETRDRIKAERRRIAEVQR